MYTSDAHDIMVVNGFVANDTLYCFTRLFQVLFILLRKVAYINGL